MSKNVKEAAEEYWENVLSDYEVGVSVHQMVVDAYLAGVGMAKAYMISLLAYRDQFLELGDEDE